MVYSTIKPILISLILFSGFSLGQEKPKKNLNPVLQSALLPGWGQKSLNYSDRSRVFTYVESGLVLSIIGSTTYANILKKNYIAYAVAHAAVSSSGKATNTGLILEISQRLKTIMMNICAIEKWMIFMKLVRSGDGSGILIHTGISLNKNVF
jgi:hypothetical protein